MVTVHRVAELDTTEATELACINGLKPWRERYIYIHVYILILCIEYNVDT